MRTIYLDFSSTTPVAASVRERMLPFLNEFYGDPSSNHWMGRAAREAMEDARGDLASLIGCHPAEIVFTSGGTESVNLALLGMAECAGNATGEHPPHLITSNLEHECVGRCADHLRHKGWENSQVACNQQGVITPQAFEAAIRPNTRMASIIHGSHQIGTLQPIQRIAEICQQRDILLHSDAAQSVGKVAVNVDRLGIDLLSLSGHKFYAPKGIGALYVRLGVPLNPILFGDSNEAGLRPGTPSLPNIVGLGQAAKLMTAGFDKAAEQLVRLQSQFISDLQIALGFQLEIHGKDAERLPHILSFELPGVSAEELQRRLPELCFSSCFPHKLGIRTGARSISKSTNGNLSRRQISNTIRVSFGWTSNEEDVRRAAQMFASAYEALSGQPGEG